MSFWRQLADHLASGEPAFVAIVGDHTRHSPGTRGAKMFVRSDTSQFGTIGGGIMEADLLARAAELLADTKAKTGAEPEAKTGPETGVDTGDEPGAQSDRDSRTEVLHHRADADGPTSGLICAGKQTMAYAVALPRDAAIYRAFADAIDAQDEVRLVLEAGQPRVEVGEAGEVGEVGEVGKTGPIRLDDETYYEHAVNHRRVAIAGGGHCGVALARVMRGLGYHVTVFETRADVFTLQDLDGAQTMVVDDYREIGAAIRYPALTHIVVMTSDFPSDVRALLGVAELDAPFKGLMGSAAKLKRIAAELDEAGFPGLYDTLYAPVGLPMTSNTPAEIAVSIAAQILAERERLFAWERPSAS